MDPIENAVVLKKARINFRATLALSCLGLPGCTGSGEALDLLVRGGTVYDGTGGEGRRSDVGVIGDRIVELGDLGERSARQVIDASGLAVAPGFINAHSWATGSLLADGRSMSDLMQGVTTEVFGEGVTLGPLDDALRARFSTERDPDFPPPGYPIEWTTLAEYLAHLEDKGVTPNVASFVGATTLRQYVIGDEDRPPDDDDLRRMVALLEAEMEQGALGVGSRLAYAPASFATTAELTALAASVAPFGGRYISHIRSEGDGLLESVDEFLEIAETARSGGIIYHLKAAGASNWHKMDDVLARIETARERGVDVSATMYPYRAGSTGLDASIPPWHHEGGPEALRARLRDPTLRPRIAREIAGDPEGWENYYYLSGGAENVILVEFQKQDLKRYQGATLAQVAEERGSSPAETIMDLVLEDESLVQTVYFLMSEDNLRKQLERPWVFIGSDAPSVAAEGAFLESSVHPRAYGTFARVLGPYVREDSVLSLQEAIRRLTSLAADELGLRDRGRILPGAFADLVVFDPATVADRATFEDPHQYATGVHHVVVNGVPALLDGRHTGATPGRALRLERP